MGPNVDSSALSGWGGEGGLYLNFVSKIKGTVSHELCWDEAFLVKPQDFFMPSERFILMVCNERYCNIEISTIYWRDSEEARCS